MEATLPPNWSRYLTDEGKEYFHNSVTNTTQWDRPEWPSGGGAFDAGNTSEVYQYKPGNDLELTQQSYKASSDTGGSPGGMAPESISLSPSAGGGSSTGGVNLSGNITPMTSAGPASGVAVSSSSSQAQPAQSGEAMSSWLLSYLQAQFDVSTEDVTTRLKLALLPMPKGDADNVFRSRPDFWGPFWIATTAVLFLAATANLTRFIEKGGQDFLGDYSLVSIAAGMIYGFLIGVPTVTRLVMYASGSEANAMDLRQMICVYGYSLTSIIPVSIICIFPNDFIQWLAVLAGLGISLAFMFMHLWADVQQEAPQMKLVIVGTIATAQVIVFSVYKLVFLHVK